MKKGWKKKKLGEICSRITDGSHNPPKGVEHSEYLMLSSQNVEDGQLNFAKVRYLSKDDFLQENERTRVTKGDVLLTIVGTIGRTCVVEEEKNITFQRSVAIFSPKDSLLPNFLKYQLMALRSTINSKANGAAQKGIYLKQLKMLEIEVASLSEQQRIVEKLDTGFAKIEQIKANAVKNLQQAKDLFLRSLEEFTDIDVDHKVSFLKDIVSTLFSGGDAPKDAYSKVQTPEFPIPIYANAVENRGLYGYTNKSRVQEPSLTIAARGSGTGYIFKRDIAYFPIVRLICIVPKADIISRDYLYYYLRRLVITRTGSAIPQLTIPMVKKYEIKYPSLPEQQRIVAKLDKLSELCKKLEDNYNRILTECDALKQSLLRQAFNGEL